MISTLFALLIAILFGFAWQQEALQLIPEPFLAIFIAAAGLLYLVAAALVHVLMLTPLQRSQKQISTALDEFIHRSLLTKVFYYIAFLFPIFSLAISLIDWPLANPYLIFIWILLFGIAVDALALLISKAMAFTNPFTVLDLLTTRAKKQLVVEKTSEVCHTFDTFTEVALKALQSRSLSVSREALDHLRSYSEEVFRVAKTKRFKVDATGQPTDIVDRVNYSVIYLFQDLGVLFTQALEGHYESLASEIVLDAGKIVLYAARADVTWGIIPIHELGKFALRAREMGMPEVVIKATITLKEIGRSILSDPEILRQDIKDLFSTLIGRLEEVTKESFRQDKTMKVGLLMKPFQDLKELLKQERLANREDIPLILVEIERVLGEYEALEMVMGKLPKIPDLGKTEGIPSTPPMQ